MTTINRTGLVLMIVMEEITPNQQLEKLWARVNRIEHSYSVLGSIARAAVDWEGDERLVELHRQIAEIHAAPFGVPKREYRISRLGHGIAHPGRVVGFWVDGVVTAEEGAPLPSDDDLHRLIGDAIEEHAIPIPSGTHLILQASPNRAFQLKL